jgi:hypothetical protein
LKLDHSAGKAVNKLTLTFEFGGDVESGSHDDYNNTRSAAGKW